MIIPFVLVLGVIGIALTLSLYSSFMPYFGLLKDIKNYNMAYYGANSAVERSLLVLRFQEAGFEGTGGQVGGTSVGPLSDSLTGDSFGFFGDTTPLFRTIKGRATNLQLPGTGNNQVEYELMDPLVDWGVLGYQDILTIPLWVDATPANEGYRDDPARQQYDGQYLAFRAKLNSKIAQVFENNLLCVTCDYDEDGVDDDMMIDRIRKGEYDDLEGVKRSYSVIPRSLVGFLTPSDPSATVYSEDEMIRASDVNHMTTDSSLSTYEDFGMLFRNNFNPLMSPTVSTLRISQRDSHLMIGEGSTFGAAPLTGMEFVELMTDSDVMNNELQFSLKNYLKTTNVDGIIHIYPFVQRILEGENDLISHPYHLVSGKSKVGAYNVEINFKKPIKGGYLESFTVIF